MKFRIGQRYRCRGMTWEIQQVSNFNGGEFLKVSVLGSGSYDFDFPAYRLCDSVKSGEAVPLLKVDDFLSSGNRDDGGYISWRGEEYTEITSLTRTRKVRNDVIALRIAEGYYDWEPDDQEDTQPVGNPCSCPMETLMFAGCKCGAITPYRFRP